MNKLFSILIVLGLLASCQGELKVDSDQLVDNSVHVTGITLDQKQVTLKEGATVTLVPTIYPENATNKEVSWSSGDVAIATVEEGKITAIKAGTTAIIAATEDGGKTAMCSVVVPQYEQPGRRVERVLLFRRCAQGQLPPLLRAIHPSRFRIMSGKAQASPTAVSLVRATSSY